MKRQKRQVLGLVQNYTTHASQKVWIKRALLLVFALVFGAIGTVLLTASNASTPTVSLESEDGNTAQCTQNVTDTTGSNGAAVKFGTCNPGGSTGFVHPGILLNTAQLDSTKAKLAASADPWLTNYYRIVGNSSKGIGAQTAHDGQAYGSLSYMPHQVASVNCSTSCPMTDDSIAAYTQALLYYYSSGSDKEARAQKVIEILNGWSGTLTSISVVNQDRLESAWSSALFSRAGEIIRYTYTPGAGQSTLDVDGLKAMLVNHFVPQITNGEAAANGNWELAMADGLVSVGVFTDDRAIYDHGIDMWRSRVPAYIYLTSDGARPAAPPGGKYNTATKMDCLWLEGAGTPLTSCTIPSGASYQNGMTQETCRDLSHVALGLSSMTNAAQTAKLQGTDLFGEQEQRIVAAYNYNANFLYQFLSSGSWPTQPCGGTGRPSQNDGCVPTSGNNNCDGTGGVAYEASWEIAYNEYANNRSQDMSAVLTLMNAYTRMKADNIVPRYKAGNNMAWETLTHATQ